MIISNAIDELKSHGVPDEVVQRIVVDLVVAGQKSVFASLGEVCGTPTLEPNHLELLLATGIARDGV